MKTLLSLSASAILLATTALGQTASGQSGSAVIEPAPPAGQQQPSERRSLLSLLGLDGVSNSDDTSDEDEDEDDRGGDDGGDEGDDSSEDD